jgi:GxxExxY protein
VNLIAAKRRKRREWGAVSAATLIFPLCDQIRETSFALHRHLRHGHVEKVYENGLSNRLRKQGVPVIQPHPLNVYDEDGTLLGDFFVGLPVAQRLLVDLNACWTLADEPIGQLPGYLRASRVEHGLLVNFGAPRLQIRKSVLSEA